MKISRNDALNKIKALKQSNIIDGIRVGLAGSVVRNEATEDSDIDLVVDSDMLDLETIEQIKEFFSPFEVDVVSLGLLKEYDEELDNMLISQGLEANEFSAYKEISREVVWCD